MAIPETPLSDEQLRATFAMKCHEWMRTAKGQKAQAIEMKERAREMQDRAAAMAKDLNSRSTGVGI